MQRFYPAVMERGPQQSFGVWFPDFPRCVVGGLTQQEAMARAQHALAQAVQALAEHERPMPAPTAFERITLPPDCDFVTFIALAVEPPDPSERVNIYLPKSLIGRADRRATELGMSRSSFFGFAVSAALSTLPFGVFGHLTPPSLRARRPRVVKTRKTRAGGQ